MITNALTIEKEAKSNLLLDDIILHEFKSTLIFLSETCGITDAFIAVKNGDQYAIHTKLGLSSVLEPYDLNYFSRFSQRNEEMIVCESKNSSGTSLFFAGFHIVIPDFFTGCICLSANAPKELSVIELKIIKQTVSKFESLLQLEQIKQHTTEKFRMFEENSNETLSQISSAGVITHASTNYTKCVGYQPTEIIGKHFLHFIHPNDIESYTTYLDTITLNIKNNLTHTYRFLHKEGHYVWRSSRLQLYKKDEKLFYVCNCTDITANVETEKQLKEQKDFYETILNNTPSDVVAFDINHKYKFLNPAAIKNDELRAYIVGKDDFEYAAHRNRDPGFAIDRRAKFKIALKTKKIYSWEETLILDDTTITYHKRSFAPVYSADGSFKLMIGFSIDLTASKKAQQTIVESRALLKNILDNTAAGIVVQGSQSEILESNISACKILGITRNQLLGKTSFDPLWQVIHEDGSYFPPEELPVPTALKTLKPVNKIIMGVHRPSKKDVVWLLVDAIPVFGEDKKLLYVICSFNDITVQKKAEHAIKISNERFKYITEASSDVIWDLDIATNQTYVGNRYTQQFGHKIANNNGLIHISQHFSLIHPEDQQLLSQQIDDVLQNPTKKKWTSEYRYMKADGSTSYVKNKAYIVRDKAGKATRLIGAMTDITLEKKLTDKVQLSEEKFKGAFEYSSIGIGLVDKNGFWFDSNKKLCSILGYSKTELQSLTFIDITHPDDVVLVTIERKSLNENRKSFFELEKRYIHKSQRIVWVNYLSSAVKDKEGNILYYLAQIIDITDRKRIEEQNAVLIEENNRIRNLQLNEAKNLYRLLAENTVDLVCMHNLNGVFEYVSPSVKKLLGYKQEELIGKSPLDFAHPDDLAHLQGSIYSFIKEAEDVAAQGRFKMANGDYIWLETKAILVKENGVPVGMQTGTRDITLHREAEEAIKNNLASEIKLNELRTNLVSTISHEFRTPMTTIRASTELIEMYLEGQQIDNATKINKHTHTITSEIDRIIDLMNAVLTISKEDSGKTTFKPTTFDLKVLCFDLIEKYYNGNDFLTQIITNVTGDSFPVFGDRHLMEYAIFNLVSNALKYSNKETNVVLNLFSLGDSVHLEIIDRGIGIPKEEQLNLFNTFFRASNTIGIQGTGLGLYIVKTFTEKNSGTVQLESELGKGTKVTLTFPVDKKN